MKRSVFLTISLKIIGLSVVYALCLLVALSLGMRGLAVAQPPTEEAKLTALAWPMVSLLNAAVLAFVVLRSRWSGWQLSAAVFVILYGAHTFLAQIESLAFLSVRNLLPPGLVQALFVAGAILAALFSPLAVLILGKWRQTTPDTDPNRRLQMPASEWLWKVIVTIVVYELLYFSFGYYVAWRNPAVQAYYEGTDQGSFLTQMANYFRETPWMPFFQALRSCLWLLIALPVVRMMKGQPWETALAVGLCYAVLMSSQLLFPNPYMPRAVSMAHLVETASSNFIFGLVVGFLLLWRPQAQKVQRLTVAHPA
jgi:hypothetical protein